MLAHEKDRKSRFLPIVMKRLYDTMKNNAVLTCDFMPVCRLGREKTLHTQGSCMHTWTILEDRPVDVRKSCMSRRRTNTGVRNVEEQTSDFSIPGFLFL